MAEPAIIRKTLAWIEDGTIEKLDTIAHDNKLWLVPFWSDKPALKLTQPGRIIRLDTLSYEENQARQNVQFVLNEKLPSSLLDPKSSGKQEKRFEVLELPDIWFEYQIEEE